MSKECTLTLAMAVLVASTFLRFVNSDSPSNEWRLLHQLTSTDSNEKQPAKKSTFFMVDAIIRTSTKFWRNCNASNEVTVGHRETSTIRKFVQPSRERRLRLPLQWVTRILFNFCRPLSSFRSAALPYCSVTSSNWGKKSTKGRRVSLFSTHRLKEW
ncbi:hypothetical protein AGDE_12589 [Angomonas deanei]|nr:hypothetical protein AGDE_12589 [Angomonas deanei]|eukprot:EPY24180.1 hypothetical protein AGDE_12589 [Angomonas deanei]